MFWISKLEKRVDYSCFLNGLCGRLCRPSYYRIAPSLSEELSPNPAACSGGLVGGVGFLFVDDGFGVVWSRVRFLGWGGFGFAVRYFGLLCGGYSCFCGV